MFTSLYSIRVLELCAQVLSLEPNVAFVRSSLKLSLQHGLQNSAMCEENKCQEIQPAKQCCSRGDS